MAVTVTSAAGIISLLEEPMQELKSFALKKLDTIVDQFWPEISEAIEKLEILYEDKVFVDNELAALVASKVYFHLGSYEDSLIYALGAGSQFDVSKKSEYVETTLATCIDSYIQQRSICSDALDTSAQFPTSQMDTSASSTFCRGIDARLVTIIDRMFERCIADRQYKHALGIALEAKRLDIVQKAILGADNVHEMLLHAFKVALNLILNLGFRNEILRKLVDLYKLMVEPDYLNMCQCLIFLNDHTAVAELLIRVADFEKGNPLLVYQIAFDLYESATQQFLNKVSLTLSARLLESNLMEVGECSDTVEDNNRPNIMLNNKDFDNLKCILTGELTTKLHLQFMIRSNHADRMILKSTKDVVRYSVCHTATVIANGFMHCGTTTDMFLRENLEWLSRATNWAKMAATASLGVIHRGHEQDAVHLMENYLPRDSAGGPVMGGMGYAESGSLYALGLIHANHGENIIDYLVEQLKNAPNEIVKHGGCIGLGLAAMGTHREDLYNQIKFLLYQDDAIVGEMAGIAMGLIMLGSNDELVLEDMIAYAHESQHEKILRGLAIGASLVMYGRCEDANTVVQRLLNGKDATLRRMAVHMMAMAYAGTGSNWAVRKLLHTAVTDVNDDVRRAAVTSLGFLFFRTPDQCPSVVSLLCESYNPHVRYGAALALGVACAGTGSHEAIALLEPLIQNDHVHFVRQGALIASAMILVQHTDQTASRATHFRDVYSQLIANKHEDVMAKFGAILAQGIIDGGGRNVTLSLSSRHGGHTNTLAVVGVLLFTQFWYWFPLAHCLALAFTPTCIITLNSELRMPKVAFMSRARPSTFAYPPPVAEKKREGKEAVNSAVLSVSARQKRREGYRIRAGDGRMELLDEMHASKKKTTNAKEKKVRINTGQEADKLDGTTEPKSTHDQEADFEILQNPARVMFPQLNVLSLASGSLYSSIKNVSSGGIIMMRKVKHNDAIDEEKEEEFVEEVEACGKSARSEKEPEPPKEFEWIESSG